MAVPTTVRQTPNGTMLKDGYSTKIAFAADPDIAFWEKDVQNPGKDGGEPIDISSMHNEKYVTKWPRTLVNTTPGATRVAYDPKVIDDIMALINIPTGITYHQPDGSTINEYGYLRSFIIDRHQIGAHPEAEVVIEHINIHPSNYTEQAGNYNSGTGTD